MESDLKIRISGYRNSGKTTVAETIKNTLTKLGMKVNIDDIDGTDNDYLPERQNTMRGRKVFIEVIQLHRMPKCNRKKYKSLMDFAVLGGDNEEIDLSTLEIIQKI
jgi:predicted ABC-type ATPase